MPELPEVETVRRGLERAMKGQRIDGVRVKRRDLRRPLPEDFEERLIGRTVSSLGRRAKYLTIGLDDGTVVLAHLGMSGRMVIDDGRNGTFVHNTAAAAAHEHIVFVLGDATIIRYADPRRFGLMDLARRESLQEHELLAHLGPEPTSDRFDGPMLSRLLADKRTPIKAALLDQRVVAGLGNIYVCEALFAAGVSPRRLAANVGATKSARLAKAIRKTLAEAIEAGGSSLRDHVTANGELGYFQHRFMAYGREGQACPEGTCDGVIRRIVQSGRSTFYCPRCQR